MEELLESQRLQVNQKTVTYDLSKQTAVEHSGLVVKSVGI